MNLPEHLVRVVRTFQTMGHDKKIHAAGIKREGLRLGQDAPSPTARETFFRQNDPSVGLERDAIDIQEIHVRKTDLEGVVAKNIRDHGIELLLFPALDVSSGIRLEPAGKLYNTG